jgi:hypothetical protein
VECCLVDHLSGEPGSAGVGHHDETTDVSPVPAHTVLQPGQSAGACHLTVILNRDQPDGFAALLLIERGMNDGLHLFVGVRGEAGPP